MILEAVNRAANKYTQLLSEIDGLTPPHIADNCFSSWAQYTIQLPKSANRADIQKALKEEGIPTNIYYPKPMHTQGAFEGTRSSVCECLTTEAVCKKVLCLPIHPYLRDEEIVFIAEKLKECVLK